jgi:ubiquinone/menaquinone biosynthesis C-methylase UbiE
MMERMEVDAGRGDQQAAESDEVVRIRSVYRERDRQGQRSAPFHEAYRRLAAERRATTRRILLRLLPEQHPGLLDVGCGGGGDLSYLRSVGWPADKLAGVDLIPSRLAAALVACPDVDLRLGDGLTIPFPDDSVDVATAATVFSSILDQDVRRALFAEMERVVRPGGVLLLYDFVIRKPTNPNVIGMPLRRLAELGRPPDWTIRISPLLQAVAVAAAIHPRLADVAMRVAPRTHRLSYWRKPPLEADVGGPGE